jgi:hypothetical protein
LSDKNLVLTSKEVLAKELDVLSKNGLLEGYDLQASYDSSSFEQVNTAEFCLFVLESFDSATKQQQQQAALSSTSNMAPASQAATTANLASCQRWAIKQENARSIGEWRLSELSTGLWHKLALTWPVNEREELIDAFRWPICGLLVADAPPLRTCISSTNGDEQQTADSTRTKLRVLKNGATDPGAAVTVSQLDAKHLMKEFIHCTKVSYRQFEFASFLTTCTQTLGLSSAARRLFDADGLEHFELGGLRQDQLVYVSTGEAWLAPAQVRHERERKNVLASLSDDLVRIGYFNRLKQCRNFVLEASGLALKTGSKIVLNNCCLNEAQLERVRLGESVQNIIELDIDQNQSNQEEVPL